MGFLLHWKPSQTTTVLCFDTLDKLQSLLGSASRRTGIKFDTADPYSLLSPLMDQVIALYDESVWSMRNHVCAAEAVRFSESRWKSDLGTSFSNYQPANGGGEESFAVSSRLWVYWVLAAPLSIIVLSVWAFREERIVRRYHKQSSSV